MLKASPALEIPTVEEEELLELLQLLECEQKNVSPKKQEKR